MEFYRPQWLWGLLLVAVPVWIHFFGIRTRKAKVIPSLLWLLKVNPSQRSKSRLKDLIVLLLRMLTIVFVVLSLARPRSSLSTKLLQVDNYPAKWNERNTWMPKLLENLDDGFYQLYDRQGTYYGTHEKAAVRTVVEKMAFTNAPVERVTGALLLSYGFDNSLQAPAWVPLRQTKLNLPIEKEVNPLGEQTFKWKVLGELTLQKNNRLVDSRSDSTYSISLDETANGQLVDLTISHDSIHEDNHFSWRPTPHSRRLILSNNVPLPINEFITLEDSVVQYSSDLAINYEIFNTVVLLGFDFIPPSLEGYAGKLVQFSNGNQYNYGGTSIPELSHPFFANFFIGPSLQNAWPEVSSYNDLGEDQEPLLRLNGVVVASLKDRVYRQGFMPKDWAHPFYRAINQWSLGSRTRIEYVPFLGSDFYESNVNLDGVDVIENPESEYSQGFAVNLYNEKLYLLLALLCALIALIFVKI